MRGTNVRRVLRFLACGLLLCAAPAAADTGKLLPTASLAKQVRSVGLLLSDSPPGSTLESKRHDGFLLRDRISQFIVDQMAAKPDTTRDQLLAQLRAILCTSPGQVCDCDHPPYIFLNSSWGGTKAAWPFVVGYQMSLGFMGAKGDVTVMESYLVEDGKARRAARGGGEFDGYVVNFQMIQQFYDPSEIWVLAWGTVQGASGRGLSGRVAVYRTTTDAVKVLWDDGDDARECNLTAQRNEIGWGVNYADRDRLYGNDPNPYFLDIYEIQYAKRTFSRVVHHQHPEE